MTDLQNCAPCAPWVGPFGMLVDSTVNAVPLPDGINWMLRDGFETELNNGGKPYLSEDAYLDKYAEKRAGDDRFWFCDWKMRLARQEKEEKEKT